MKYFGTLTLAAVSLMLLGCERNVGEYKLESKEGQTHLVDIASGKRVLVTYQLFEPPPPPPPTPAEVAAKASSWKLSSDSLPGADFGFEISTKFRDGMVEYIAVAKPYTSKMERERTRAYTNAMLVMKFKDSDGFPAFQDIRLRLSEANPLVESDGKYAGIHWTGKVPTTVERYLTATSLGTGTSGMLNKIEEEVQ